MELPVATDERGKGGRGWLRSRLAGLYLTFLTTLGAYCFSAVVQFSGLTNVDQVSWRLLASIALPLATSQTSTDSVVLTIGDEYFEREFQQSSPLNRAELARIVGKVAASLEGGTPPTVAFDLDLSPVTQPTADQKAAQAALDGALLALAQRARVVLICPLAKTDSVQQQQLAWAESLAKRVQAQAGATPGGLHFALPDLQVQAGAVLHYDAATPSLGVVAGSPAGATVADPVAPCRDVPPGTAPRPAMRKINFAGYGAQSTMELTAGTPVGDLLGMWRPRLILVGGSYSLAGDEFGTAAGERLPGVALHAAVAYSVQHPVGAAPMLMNHLLQFTVIGLVLAAGSRLVRFAFGLLRLKGTHRRYGARARTTARWLWGSQENADALAGAELWVRSLAGFLLLVVSFALLAAGLGAVSIGLMVLFGYWYEFLLSAGVAFFKAVTTEQKGLMQELAQHGADAAAPAAPPETDPHAPAQASPSAHGGVLLGKSPPPRGAPPKRALLPRAAKDRLIAALALVLRLAVLLGGAAYMIAKTFA